MISTRTITLAVTSAFLLLSTVSKAQITEWEVERQRQSYAEWGIKAGANFQQNNGYPFIQAYNPGGIAGLYISKHGKTFGLKLEATVSSAEYKTFNAASHAYSSTKAQNSDTITKGDFTALSVNIPLMLEIRPCKHFLFQLGGQYNHLLTVSDKNDAFKKAWNNDKVFKTESYGIIFGIEEDITYNLKIGATYTSNLSDINNGAFLGVSDKWLTNSAQVYLVYKLGRWFPRKHAK